MKYVETEIVFREIPDEITLAINISNCPHKCVGCHSPYLQSDIGEKLTQRTIRKLAEENNGITCIALMGGDAEPELINLFGYIIHRCKLKSAWYSGNSKVDDNVNINNFDFIKIGPYRKTRGSLNNENTNQIFYENINNELVDKTYKFWNVY